MPTALEDLRLGHLGGGDVELTWTDLIPRFGGDAWHEVASDTIASMHVAGAAVAPCVATDLADARYVDSDPAVGGRYFLVRGVGACGPPPTERWGIDWPPVVRPACP